MSSPTQLEEHVAWASGTHVVHLDLECPGLDRMRSFGKDPAELFAPIAYRRVTDLIGAHTEGHRATLCRLCSVEAVVCDIVAQYPLRDADAGVFVTFTLARPRNQPVKTKARFRRDGERGLALAEEAGIRLTRIAAATGLHVTRANNRPAAYGFIARDALELLAQVVRTEPKYTVTELPDAGMVSTFWSFVAEAERGLPVGADLDPEVADPWYLAELVCSAPA